MSSNAALKPSVVKLYVEYIEKVTKELRAGKTPSVVCTRSLKTHPEIKINE